MKKQENHSQTMFFLQLFYSLEVEVGDSMLLMLLCCWLLLLQFICTLEATERKTVMHQLRATRSQRGDKK